MKTKLESAAKIKTEKAAASKFSIEKLRENCQKLFGVSVSTFDGAVHGKSGEFTVAEMKGIISKWKKEEVKQ